MTDLGFDEGGVLQALATPILQHEVETTRKTKKGKIIVSKTKYELTGAQVIVLLLGPAFLALFLRFKSLTDEEKVETVDLLLGGPLGPQWRKYMEKNPLFGVGPIAALKQAVAPTPEPGAKTIGLFSKTEGVIG